MSLDLDSAEENDLCIYSRRLTQSLFLSIIGLIDCLTGFIAPRNFARSRLSIANVDADLCGNAYRRAGFLLKLATPTLRQTFLSSLQNLLRDLLTR